MFALRLLALTEVPQMASRREEQVAAACLLAGDAHKRLVCCADTKPLSCDMLRAWPADRQLLISFRSPHWPTLMFLCRIWGSL